MSTDEWDGLQETLEILADQDAVRSLARAEEEDARGDLLGLEEARPEIEAAMRARLAAAEELAGRGARGEFDEAAEAHAAARAARHGYPGSGKGGRDMDRVVHIPYTVEQDEDGVWCAHAQLRPNVGAHGEGDTEEAAIDDLREALGGLIQEFGVPDELTLTLDVA